MDGRQRKIGKTGFSGRRERGEWSGSAGDAIRQVEGDGTRNRKRKKGERSKSGEGWTLCAPVVRPEKVCTKLTQYDTKKNAGGVATLVTKKGTSWRR